MSALENETRFETTTFDYFDRSWEVPTKRHLSHLVRMRDEARTGFVSPNLMVSEVMLGPAQFADLVTINPDEVELDGFVNAISKAMGLGDTGN